MSDTLGFKIDHELASLFAKPTEEQRKAIKRGFRSQRHRFVNVWEDDENDQVVLLDDPARLEILMEDRIVRGSAYRSSPARGSLGMDFGPPMGQPRLAEKRKGRPRRKGQ